MRRVILAGLLALGPQALPERAAAAPPAPSKAGKKKKDKKAEKAEPPVAAQPDSIEPPAAAAPARPAKPVDGPTMEETTAWLTEKLAANAVAYHTVAHWIEHHVMTFDTTDTCDWERHYANVKLVNQPGGCQLSFKEVRKTSCNMVTNGRPGDREPPQVDDMDSLFILNGLDPVGLVPEPFDYKRQSSAPASAQVTVDHDLYFLSLQPPTQGLQIGILFQDHEMAKRVAKALRHVIDLCGGGKTEPF
jgi:hypothetical protein